MSISLRASDSSGGCEGNLPGGLQLHRRSEVLSSQPIRSHLRPAGAARPWGRPPGHQRYCLNTLDVTQELFASFLHIQDQLQKMCCCDSCVCTHKQNSEVHNQASHVSVCKHENAPHSSGPRRAVGCLVLHPTTLEGCMIQAS